MLCPVCGKEMRIERVPYTTEGTPLGEFEASVCHDDDMVFFTEESAKNIELAEKELGMWGIDMPRIELDDTIPPTAGNFHIRYRNLIPLPNAVSYTISST